jgi:large subunit ribosomal protein L4
MDLKLINDQGQPAVTVVGSDALFARDYNEALIHQVITAFQANGRGGNRAQKGRGEVNKSNRKPWAQKGTGRARAGRASSPLWRGGGKIFPSSPDDNFTQKVNRRCTAPWRDPFAARARGRLSVIADLVEAPKAPSRRRSRRWA